MIDDKIDVDVYPSKKGWNVVVSYWYYNRNKNKKRLSSSVTYMVYGLLRNSRVFETEAN